MTQIFGDFIEELPEQEEFLTIGFSPASAPLQKRWENNGLSADFMADYFKTFFVNKQTSEKGKEESVFIENLRGAVKYIANELLENAMKFQDRDMPFTARIGFSMYNDKLVFCVTNGIDEWQVEPFQAFIKKLLNEDPSELYFQTMKANAINNADSKLGILSMICDYSAKLGWKFEKIQTSPPIMVVNTMVCLELSALT